MKLKFTKMHGCGNDYIYINCLNTNYKEFLDFSKLSKRLCEYHFGIGADGVILICKPSEKTFDAKMLMYNKDGNPGKMCGNGIRCVVKYLHDVLKIKKEIFLIETASGVKSIQVQAELERDSKEMLAKTITVNIGTPDFSPKHVPVNVKDVPLEEVINFNVSINNNNYNLNCVSLGNPHCVLIIYEEDINKIDLKRISEDFSNCKDLFPEGVNIEIVNIKNDNLINVRVWERGSEETLACGTGACACFAVLSKLNLININKPLTVNLKGGVLTVFSKKGDDSIFLSGPSEVVYKGVVDVQGCSKLHYESMF